jgi:uncharacterized protein (DUF1697 family)
MTIRSEQRTTFVALLRAINVSGTGILPMKDLSEICVNLGFSNVRTYIQSGNVVFTSSLAAESVRTALEQRLSTRMGKKIDVLVRTAAELQGILAANPFPEQPPAKVSVLFLSAPPSTSLLNDVIAPGGEQVRLGHREIYLYYPDGMGRTKLKLPRLNGPATARNINTVAKLVAMATA